MSPLVWAALLLLLALAIVALEMFVPSGGVLGFLAALSAAAGVFVAYYYGGPVTGTFFLGAVVVALPLLLAAAVKVWPLTPVGKSILIGLPESEDDVLPDDPDGRHLATLVGRRGVARSDLIPSGAIVIDKKTYDAVSLGQVIDRGRDVRVVAVRMHCLVVRPLEAAEAEILSSDDPLSQPLGELGLEPFEPLA